VGGAGILAGKPTSMSAFGEARRLLGFKEEVDAYLTQA
jgi:hypothetical protein